MNIYKENNLFNIIIYNNNREKLFNDNYLPEIKEIYANLYLKCEGYNDYSDFKNGIRIAYPRYKNKFIAIGKDNTVIIPEKVYDPENHYDTSLWVPYDNISYLIKITSTSGNNNIDFIVNINKIKIAQSMISSMYQTDNLSMHTCYVFENSKDGHVQDIFKNINI